MREGKSLSTSYLLAFFLGGLGAHLFYIGKYKRAIFYLLFCWTYIPVFLGWIDMFSIKKWIQQNSRGGGASLSEDFHKSITKVNKTPMKKEPEKLINLNYTPISKNKLFYDEQVIILSKYAHLRTPERIMNEIERIKNPKKRSSSTSNGITITFSVSSSHAEFFEDSAKYAHLAGTPCERQTLMEYWTTFRSLNKQQMSWYLYWRSQALHGNFMDTDLSYIILFTYELLNYSFNSKAAFNVSMIARLYENYKDREPKVDNYLPKWITDLLLELGEEKMANEWEQDYRNKNSLYEQITKQRHELHRVSVTHWKPYIRNYRETEFFQKNKNKIYSVFKGSMPILDKMLEEQGKDLANEWFEVKESYMTRYMFNSAVMGRSTINIEVPYTALQHTDKLCTDVSSLFRIAENVTRSLMGEKRELKVDETVLPEGMKQRMMETFAVNSSNRVGSRFVKVQGVSKTDGGSSIPKRPANEETSVPPMVFTLDLGAVEEAKKGNEEFGSLYNEHYGDDDGHEEVAVTVDNPTPEVVEDKQNATMIANLFEQVSVDEESFMEDLSEMEVQLMLVFDSDIMLIADINSFAKTKGMSASVMITSINEKAIEHLGDNLIEQDGDEYIIVEEYIALLQRVKGANS